MSCTFSGNCFGFDGGSLLAECLPNLELLENLELESTALSELGPDTIPSFGMRGCYTLVKAAEKMSKLVRINLMFTPINPDTKKAIMDLQKVKSGELQVLLDADLRPSSLGQGLNAFNTSACYRFGVGDNNPVRSSAAQLVRGDINRGSAHFHGISEIHFVSGSGIRILRGECFCPTMAKGYYELEIIKDCSDGNFGFLPLTQWPLISGSTYVNYSDAVANEFLPASWFWGDQELRLKHGDVIGLGCDLTNQEKTTVNVWIYSGDEIIFKTKDLDHPKYRQGLCPAFSCSVGALSCNLGGLGWLQNFKKIPDGYSAIGSFLPPPLAEFKNMEVETERQLIEMIDEQVTFTVMESKVVPTTVVQCKVVKETIMEQENIRTIEVPFTVYRTIQEPKQVTKDIKVQKPVKFTQKEIQNVLVPMTQPPLEGEATPQTPGPTFTHSTYQSPSSNLPYHSPSNNTPYNSSSMMNYGHSGVRTVGHHVVGGTAYHVSGGRLDV